MAGFKVFDSENETWVDENLSEHEAFIRKAREERLTKSRGLNRYIIEDPEGNRYSAADCECGQYHHRDATEREVKG